MPMTVIATRNVEDRYRGFLASCMLEIAPGVYTGPRMTSGVRERVWRVLSEWHAALRQGAIVMTWSEPAAPGAHRRRVLHDAVPRRLPPRIDHPGWGLDRLHACHRSLSTAKPLWLSHPTHLRCKGQIPVTQTDMITPGFSAAR